MLHSGAVVMMKVEDLYPLGRLKCKLVFSQGAHAGKMTIGLTFGVNVCNPEWDKWV